MTYQPEIQGQALADVNGFAFLLPSHNTSPAVGSVIPWNSVNYEKGSGFASLSSGAVTLAAGYWYYIEATAQAHSEGSISATVPQGAKYQWHESASPVGSYGRVASYKVDAYSTEVGDEKAIHLVDATSGAVTLDLRVIATFGAALIAMNYDSVHNIYGGYGRAVVVQLKNAP